MDLAYPSATFPAHLPVTLSLPDTFEPVRSPDALLGAADTASPPPFTANIFVISSRVLSDATLDEMAAEVRDKTTAEYADARLSPTSHSLIGGVDALTTIAVLTPAGVDFEVEQIQTVLFVPTGNEAVRDLLQVHASYAADTRDTYAAVFATAITGLELG
jgi:hypothetical protein